MKKKFQKTLILAFQKTLILAFEANSALSRKNETKIEKIAHSAKAAIIQNEMVIFFKACFLPILGLLG